jgi:hypothetical protein
MEFQPCYSFAKMDVKPMTIGAYCCFGGAFLLLITAAFMDREKEG